VITATLVLNASQASHTCAAALQIEAASRSPVITATLVLNASQASHTCAAALQIEAASRSPVITATLVLNASQASTHTCAASPDRTSHTSKRLFGKRRAHWRAEEPINTTAKMKFLVALIGKGRLLVQPEDPCRCGAGESVKGYC